MTLRDVMQRVEEDHGLRATEQMYKKRLKSWNLSKHIKADEKEKVLGKLLHDEPATTDISHVRHDKLVRYAKSRVKSGTLDRDGLTMVVDLGRLQKNKHSSTQRPNVVRRAGMLASRNAKTRAATSPPPSLSLPDGPANLDMFLRSMRAVIAREREESLLGLSFSPDGIFVALNEGLAHWRAGEVSLACGSFSDAAQLLSEDIQGPVVIVSRITYCISSIVWGNIREKIFIGFARFMAKVTLEKQGKDFPLTRMLKHLRREQSIDAQLAIWACALDDYQISQQNVVHWWNMAQRRWRWCLRSGKPELATRYCKYAIAESRRIGVLTSDMEREAQQDFEPTNHAPGP
ncbi:hypothetical protein LTR84_011870 [Exophiala bonariae]|uniref:Clr5 domain-containing protein n=1 Tax=Exophiala bonariae TaxID=1690606 RepID=A0AAV9NHN6_9EURO|nr:hypothetical protein LTR84_011870 [Exophiala bonariae]